MAVTNDELQEELDDVHKNFGSKSKELSTVASDKAKGSGSWTKEHAKTLHEDLDASLHKIKMKLSKSDDPAHEELEVKVDEARVDMEAEFDIIEDADHEKTHNIVNSFHKRVDEWMDDISTSGREW